MAKNLPALLPAKPQPRHTAEFHPGHVVEEHVRVYLRLTEDGSGWEIDPITFDGWPLEGLTSGPVPRESDCECENEEQCWQVHNYAAKIDLPTGKELCKMLFNYINNGGG